MLERERNNMSLCERVYETKNRDECQTQVSLKCVFVCRRVFGWRVCEWCNESVGETVCESDMQQKEMNIQIGPKVKHLLTIVIHVLHTF